MLIRPVAESEVPMLCSFATRIFRETFLSQNSPEQLDRFLSEHYTEEKFEAEFKEPDSGYYWAWDVHVPAGYLRLRVNHEVANLLGQATLEIQRLYVDVDYQGKGVANLLMQFAIDEAKRKNAEWLWLGVWEHNVRAQRFYQRWGFSVFSEHVFFLGDEAQTDWLMRKAI